MARRRRSGITRPLLILLAIILLAGLAFGGYYLATQPGGMASNNNNASQKPTGADEWPAYMYDGARRGFNSGEKRLSPANASRLKLLWKAQLGNVLAAQPIVKGDVVYA